MITLISYALWVLCILPFPLGLPRAHGCKEHQGVRILGAVSLRSADNHPYSYLPLASLASLPSGLVQMSLSALRTHPPILW